MKKLTSAALCIMMLTALVFPAALCADAGDERIPTASERGNDMNGYIIVTDFLDGNADQRDVSDILQQIIDANPNRTIYFPDGVYPISKPILTSSDPKKSVSLLLSAYAIIRATDDWSGGDEAMIRLGAKGNVNDIRTCGSNYSFSGGVIDGNMIAAGISIDGGRETAVRDVSIKHTTVGLRIKFGANSGSSDADVMNVNIVGNRSVDSIGVLLEGYDNTLTNMRIADVFTGVLLKSEGNVMRNLHPLYTCDYKNYTNSCGFKDEKGSNWYYFCYSDHFGVGFGFADNAVAICDSCFCLWYGAKFKKHVAVRAEGRFRAIMTNFKVGFYDATTANYILEEKTPGGDGVFDRLIIKGACPPSNEDHLPHVVGGIVTY